MESSMIIDTDTHIIEPRDAWTARMSSKKWGELIPHVRWDDELQKERWYVGDTRVFDVGMSVAMRGNGPSPMRWTGGLTDLPSQFDLVHPSAFDGAERIKVMDEYGIDVEVLYPNLPQVLTSSKLQNLVTSDVRQYELECVRAYNDFVLDWISPDPDRFVPLASIPYWDVEGT